MIAQITRITVIGLIMVMSACSVDPGKAISVAGSSTGEAQLVEYCRQDSSRPCLVDSAYSSLAQIEDDLDWVHAATELVSAIGTSDPDRAVLLLDQSLVRAQAIPGAVGQTDALTRIAEVSTNLKLTLQGSRLMQNALVAAELIEDEVARWDALGKLAVVQVKNGSILSAWSLVERMPQNNDRLASLKARTYHDMAPVFAKRGDFAAADRALDAMTMGLVYYPAAARTDVATFAFESDKSNRTAQLLADAERLARSQEDGYFVAGALRHIASSYAQTSEPSRADEFFQDAEQAARLIHVTQKRARAMSRVATALADFERYNEAHDLVLDAFDNAKTETNAVLRQWCFYELAGSAAFAGAFELATEISFLIPDDATLSEKPLKSVTLRDIAWGLTRHQRIEEAVVVVESIATPRERVQAFSRMIRIIDNPAMRALPRYL